MKASVLLFCVLIGVSSCGDYDSPPSDAFNGRPGVNGVVGQQAFNEEQLVKNLGEDVITPAYARFHKNLKRFDKKLNDWCEGSETSVGPSLKNNFQKVMDNFHFVEAFMFGPIKEEDGKLLSRIYTKDLTNTCRIDRDIARMHFRPDTTVGERAATTGIDAMEYLIFSEKVFSCARARGQLLEWSKLDAATRKTARCKFMTQVSSLIKKETKAVSLAWSKEGGDFTTKMIETRVFGDVGQTLNVIFKSLFFLEKEFKDLKIGAVVGKHDTCRNLKCPEKVEHQVSKTGLRAMYYNLLGFASIFRGRDELDPRSKKSFGFEDYLSTSNIDGVNEFKKTMNDNLDKAIENFQAAIDDDLKAEAESMDPNKCVATTSENRQVEICALHQDVKKIGDALKNELTVYLSTLTAPRDAQGDND